VKIYFVRHGESEANILNVFSNRDLPHALTELGKEQVTTLAQRLKSDTFLAIYSSPILRAVQSSAILSDRLGVPYETTDALLEYDVGIYEGRSDEEGWKRYAEVLDEWFVHRNWDASVGEGESLNDIRDRFVPFIETLKGRYGNEQGSIILVGHGGTYRCMLPLVLSNVDFSFSMDNTIGHTSYVLADLRGDDLVCLRWGDHVPGVGDQR
jgi:broad specificity phosphatase PhoE